MKAGKQYYKADGTQVAVYFMPVMGITQGVDGSYSHRGTKNMDDAGADTGIDVAYASFDGTITWKQVTGDKTGILFSSNHPVWTKLFGKVYVNILFWHDNDTSDLYKGKVIMQGTRLYEEGTAGRATGNHIHYGVSIGKYAGGYPLVKNSAGNWELPNEVNPWDVFFVNDTVIRKSGGYNWATFKEDVPAPAPITGFKVGDLVKIIGTNWTTGQVIGDYTKAQTHVVGQISADKSKVLLVRAVDPTGKIVYKGVYSWILSKDIKKV